MSFFSCFLFHQWLSVVITLFESEPVTNNLPSWFRCSVQAEILCHLFVMYNIAANIGIAVYLADSSIFLQLLCSDWDWREEVCQWFWMIWHCINEHVFASLHFASYVTSCEHYAIEDVFILVLFLTACYQQNQHDSQVNLQAWNSTFAL